jgi:hypothetical protein
LGAVRAKLGSVKMAMEEIIISGRFSLGSGRTCLAKPYTGSLY